MTNRPTHLKANGPHLTISVLALLLTGCAAAPAAPGVNQGQASSSEVGSSSGEDAGAGEEIDASEIFSDDSILCTDLELRKPELRDQPIGCMSPEILEPRAKEVATALRDSGYYVSAVGGVEAQHLAFVILSTDRTCDQESQLITYDGVADTFLIPPADAQGTSSPTSYTVPVATAEEAVAAFTGAPFNCN